MDGAVKTNATRNFRRNSMRRGESNGTLYRLFPRDSGNGSLLLVDTNTRLICHGIFDEWVTPRPENVAVKD